MQAQQLQGFRLSPQQRQLWSLETGDAGSCARCALRLTGKVEEGVLARALRRVVERHEILRTAFIRPAVLIFPLQIIEEGCTPTWCLLDLEGLAPRQQEVRIRELFAAEARRPIDFARPPLLRCSLLRLSMDEHVLLLSLPALCADSRTFGNLLGELARAYGAITDGREVDGEVVQYLEFSEWRNDLLGDETEVEGREFWQARSPWSLPIIALPFEKPGTGPGEYLPSRISTSFEPQVVSTVRAAARSEEVPVSVFLLACWQALLWRFTRQSEIVVSHVVEGRDYPELHDVLGPLASTLPIHVEIAGQLPFRSLLKRVHADVLAVSRWQEYLMPPTDNERPTRSDQFPIGFELEARVPCQQAAGVGFAVLEQEVCNDRMKLKLHLVEVEDAWRAELQYDPAVFRHEDVRRLSGHFEVLLAGAAADPRVQVEELEVLWQGERDLLVAGFNDTAFPFPRECVHQMFERQAAAVPDADALVFQDRRLTFAGLNAEANRLAHHLRSLGAEPDGVVAIALGRSHETVVGLLGVLKAGAAYVPLDLSQPKERLALMLEDCRPAILLTRQGLLGLLPESGGKVVCLDRDQAVIGRWSAEDPISQAEPENLAYVMFTSGSTGRPKGVAVEHRQLANYIHGIRTRLDLPVGARFAMVSTFAADLGNTTVFPSLCEGGCLHILSEELSSDTAALAEYFERHAIDCLKIVPSHLEALRAGASSQGVLPKRCLVLGGEASRSDWVQELRSSASCRVLNHYGPSETTVGVLTHEVMEACGEPQAATVPIGRPLPNSRVYLLDRHLHPVPVWVPGELYVSGAGLARGYLHRPELTAERFVPDPWSPESGARMYRTGDLARHLPAGAIEFLGRGDDQVKIRGFRIELGEVEAVLHRHPAVRQSVVLVRQGAPDEKRLVAYVVPRGEDLDRDALRSFLKAHLPEPMVPGPLVTLKSLPLLPNGKVDRRSLPDPGQLDSRASYVPPQSEVGRTIAAVWQEVLGVEKVGELDNFFDLGGHSLLLVRVHAKLREAGFDLSMTDLFRYPTVRALAGYLGETEEERRLAGVTAAAARQSRRSEAPRTGNDVAIIGMAGRFPGAGSIEELWRNLRDGRETVTFFSDAELAAAGVSPELLADPRYVRAGSLLEGGDLFDAGFFGYSPREAQILDPQHRIFLESAWETFENAGYDPERLCGRVGIFAGAGVNTYLFNLLSDPDFLRAVGRWQVRLGNRSDFLATRVSYKLNLKGPSLNVQSACSTSLVAVFLACESLVNGQCEMALAGGVAVAAQQRLGYLYEEGGINSPDGHTRAFDALGRGTIAGDGVGVVLLKRLEDALADGDAVRAVLKGWAINNDGSLKVGFTAPSVEGQARVVSEAQAAAGVEPESIGYVETHGTGTRLGDPIEIAALTQAFRARTATKRFCAIGSVKTNVGHLDAAAGVTGLIKTVLALENRQIPPSLHFDQPNPGIDFGNSPFYVNTALTEWQANGTPRRAGVSSFGIGGTNCHMVLEEAPEPSSAGEARPWELLVLSARTPSALEHATTNLARHLASHPEQDLADVAYTLGVGRKVFPCRRMLVCSDRDDAVIALEAREPERLVSAQQEVSCRPVAFLFPGQGAQHLGMAAGLYREEPTFRSWVDHAVELLTPQLGFDLRQVLVPEQGDAKAARRLAETAVVQPALFVVEHALARLWMEWGLQPESMLGHSIGEYVAACLAGVFPLEDALALVAARGRLMQQLPAGLMLAVSLPAGDVLELLDEEVALAAVNAPASCVLSGPPAAISALEERLAASGVEVRRLQTSHAFHSSMMDPVLNDFAAEIGKVTLAPPAIPYLSNLTGAWITAAQATDPDYWVRHLRSTVRFADGIRDLLARPERILLEVGPGTVLASLVRQDREQTTDRVVISSLGHPRDPRPDMQCLLHALGALWLVGAEVDWTKAHAPEGCHRVPLPTYSFERQRYWVDLRPLSSPPKREQGSRRAEPPRQPEQIMSLADRTKLLSADAGPRTALEQELAVLWRELLGVDRVGIHDDFFELGGSSLLAVRMGSRLYEKLNVRLSPDFLLTAPTVAGMAGLIEADPSVAPSPSPAVKPRTCMVEIQKGNGCGKLPLYLMHTMGGHLYYYHRLARELGEDQPVYGLRALGLEEGEEPLSSIEELASHYLDLVRIHQPTGPYLLGGSSMGGLLAYEMAQQLHAQGQEVRLLAMMDTTHPDQIPKALVPRDEADLMVQLYGTWLQISARKIRRLRPEARLAYIAQMLEGNSAVPEDLALHDTRRHLQVFEALWQAKLAYRPRPSSAKLLYFRARERGGYVPNPELDWIELTERGTETQVVPGNHNTMHDPPHVRTLGERLKRALDRICLSADNLRNLCPARDGQEHLFM